MTKLLSYGCHPSTSLRMTIFVALTDLLLGQPLLICPLIQLVRARTGDGLCYSGGWHSQTRLGVQLPDKLGEFRRSKSPCGFRHFMF